ncbi:MAG: precorrin-8X methylmutase [Tissierellia bacterium]|nr:precorrin-8X methylmutase [Tissierellia bacterium]
MYEKKPMTIENKSMDIIDGYLDDVSFTEEELPVVRRMIHTTGDPEYRHIIDIHPSFLEGAKEALKRGIKIYTDTNMGNQGINKAALQKSGSELLTLVSDPEVAKLAKERETTRSIVALEEGIKRGCTAFVIGNAPTALFRLLELVEEGAVTPDFIVATPVGFVGAAESKDAIAETELPYIRTVGTKGGSNVAASVVNALLYEVFPR